MQKYILQELGIGTQPTHTVEWNAIFFTFKISSSDVIYLYL